MQRACLLLCPYLCCCLSIARPERGRGPLPENIIIDSSGNIVIFDNNGAAYNVVRIFVHHHPNSDHVLYHQRGSLDVVFDHSRANNLKLFKHDLKLFKHPCDNDHYGATARHTTPSMHGLEGCRCWERGRGQQLLARNAGQMAAHFRIRAFSVFRRACSQYFSAHPAERMPALRSVRWIARVHRRELLQRI
jgi:hypothetical protein